MDCIQADDREEQALRVWTGNTSAKKVGVKIISISNARIVLLSCENITLTQIHVVHSIAKYALALHPECSTAGRLPLFLFVFGSRAIQHCKR